MPNTLALIPIDLEHTALGFKSLVAQQVQGRSVLSHVVARAARVSAVDEIVLVHPPGYDPTLLIGDAVFAKPVSCEVVEPSSADRFHDMRVIARKWAQTAWRGGLGGATCFDELLPAGPLVKAMAARDAESALLVGSDWLCVDPSICSAVLDLHLSDPKAYAMTFTQAPPGLGGAAVSRSMLEDLAEHDVTFGQMLGYNPTHAQADPIGRDVCVPIDAAVRSCAERFIYDTPRAAAMFDAIAERLGDDLHEAGAASIVAATPADRSALTSLPRQVTVELTPRRGVSGPITPQHHVAFERADMPLDLALRLVEQIAESPDTVVTLGGLGDALLHEDWRAVVEAARDAGVCGVAIETDLLVDSDVVDALLDAPVDVVSPRVNADSAETYRQVMGHDMFSQVAANMERLINGRNKRNNDASAQRGVPWIVPRLVKTRQTLGDMESFFDRWTHYLGHAVIEPAACGRGDGVDLSPAASPVCMAPPRRSACRQVERRMTVLSDGVVARCDQDWVGVGCAGDAKVATLAEIWSSMNALRDTHRQGQWGDDAVCGGCVEWHRP